MKCKLFKNYESTENPSKTCIGAHWLTSVINVLARCVSQTLSCYCCSTYEKQQVFCWSPFQSCES